MALIAAAESTVPAVRMIRCKGLIATLASRAARPSHVQDCLCAVRDAAVNGSLAVARALTLLHAVAAHCVRAVSTYDDETVLNE